MLPDPYEIMTFPKNMLSKSFRLFIWMLISQQKGICESDHTNLGQEMTSVTVYNAVAREGIISMKT